MQKLWSGRTAMLHEALPQTPQTRGEKSQMGWKQPGARLAGELYWKENRSVESLRGLPYRPHS